MPAELAKIWAMLWKIVGWAMTVSNHMQSLFGNYETLPQYRRLPIIMIQDLYSASSLPHLLISMDGRNSFSCSACGAEWEIWMCMTSLIVHKHVDSANFFLHLDNPFSQNIIAESIWTNKNIPTPTMQCSFSKFCHLSERCSGKGRRLRHKMLRFLGWAVTSPLQVKKLKA